VDEADIYTGRPYTFVTPPHRRRSTPTYFRISNMQEVRMHSHGIRNNPLSCVGIGSLESFITTHASRHGW